MTHIVTFLVCSMPVLNVNNILMLKEEERQFLYFYASFLCLRSIGEIDCNQLTVADQFKDFCLCLYTKAWRIHTLKQADSSAYHDQYYLTKECNYN